MKNSDFFFIIKAELYFRPKFIYFLKSVAGNIQQLYIPCKMFFCKQKKKKKKNPHN